MADSKKKFSVVTSPLVAVKTDDGRRIYAYRGTELGDGFDKEDVARLADMGLVGDPDNSVVPGVGA